MTSRLRALLAEHGPLLAVMAVLAVYGAWYDAAGLAHPTAIGPRTLFTPGQHLAAAIAWAQVQMDGTFSTRTPLLGWPDLAEFRVVMWPTQLLALLVGPLVAVNLVFVLAPAVNAACGAVLGKVLGLDRWGRAALGGAMAWSPWVRETLTNGQLEQVVVGVVALVWAAAIATSRRTSPAWYVLVAALTWGAGMTAPHLCLAAGLGLGLWALADVATTREGRWALAARWAVILALAGAAALTANRYHSPNFTGGVQVFFPKGSDGHPGGLPGLPEQATLPSLLLPPTERPTDITAIHPTYLGLVAVGFALAALRRGPNAIRLATVTVGLALFSLGAQVPFGSANVPGPYALLGLVSPAIAQSGSAYRVVGAVTVALAGLAALAIRGPKTFVALVAAAWVETTLVATRSLPFPPMDFDPDPTVAPFREHAGAILDLPLVGPQCPNATYHYVFEATRRLRPTPILPAAPGLYPTIPALQQRFREAVREPSCGEALQALVTGTGFTGVVLHLHDPTCRAPSALTRCLEEAWGPGEAGPGHRWWDPLPPLPPGVTPSIRIPERPDPDRLGGRPPELPPGPPPGPPPAGPDDGMRLPADGPAGAAP